MANRKRTRPERRLIAYEDNCRDVAWAVSDLMALVTEPVPEALQGTWRDLKTFVDMTLSGLTCDFCFEYPCICHIPRDKPDDVPELEEFERFDDTTL
jgi:hypothetical protein